MNLWQDIRYGERMLRKSPGFAITAVLTLALGIGATTAVFSVCDSLLWKPIDLPRMESLVMVLQRVSDNANDWDSVSPGDLDDVSRQTTALANVAVWDQGQANIVGAGGEPERAFRALVSANFFTTIGVQPVLGRAETPLRSILNYAQDHFCRHLPVVFFLTVIGPRADGVSFPGRSSRAGSAKWC